MVFLRVLHESAHVANRERDVRSHESDIAVHR
jgi:hypothetical protein